MGEGADQQPMNLNSDQLQPVSSATMHNDELELQISDIVLCCTFNA